MINHSQLKSHYTEFLSLVVIAICIALLSLVELQTSIAIFLGTFISASIPAYRKISEIVRKREKKRKRRKEIKQIVQSLSKNLDSLNILPSETKSSHTLINKIKEEKVSRDKASIYFFTVDWIFNDLSSTEKLITTMLVNSQEIENSSNFKDEQRLRDINDSLLDNFSLESISEDERKLVTAFKFFASSETEKIDAKQLFNPDNREEDVIKAKILEISKDYCKGSEFAHSLFQDKKKVEEFRSTLAELFSRGKLRLEGVEKDIDDIKENLHERSQKQKYMVFCQKYQRDKAVEERIESFPYLYFGTKNVENDFPESIKYTSTYIIDPEMEYQSASDFLETELKPVLPDIEGGFIAVMPLEFGELESYPSEIDEDLSGALEYLKTGSGINVEKIISEKITSEVKVSKLMSSVPFNVLVPEMKEVEKDVIIDNYEVLKEKFAVDELFDWGEKNSEELGTKLDQLDKENVANEQRWIELAENICREARECNKATFATA